MKNIYLAGPMRGYANFNKPAFMAAAAALRAEGYRVFNPVEETIKLYGEGVYEDNPGGDEEITPIDPRKVFYNDLTFICLHADAVVILPGWEKSKGATAENATALALGLPVFDLAEIVG
jgi:nucleoside 2-deoxyribosyltransferase